MLNACRQFLAWRRHHPALKAGSIRFLDAPENVLAFVRENEKERVLAVFNLSAKPASYPSDRAIAPLKGHGFTEALSAGKIQLPAYGAFFGNLER